MTAPAFQAGIVTEVGRLTGNSATDVFTAEGATYIRDITVCENTGAATPTCSIARYDGTNTYIIRGAVALTAGVPYTYDVPFLLPPGWKIRITSGDAAGKVDWCVTYDPPAAARIR